MNERLGITIEEPIAVGVKPSISQPTELSSSYLVLIASSFVMLFLALGVVVMGIWDTPASQSLYFWLGSWLFG